MTGCPPTRQWIYEKYGDVFMLDDDSMRMLRIYRAKGARRSALVSAQRCWEIIQATADTARKLGAYLFGFASHTSPMCFREHRPFKFGGYTPSGAVGVLNRSKLWRPGIQGAMSRTGHREHRAAHRTRELRAAAALRKVLR